MTDMWSRDGLACSMRSPEIGKEEILTVREVTNSGSKTDCNKLSYSYLRTAFINFTASTFMDEQGHSMLVFVVCNRDSVLSLTAM